MTTLRSACERTCAARGQTFRAGEGSAENALAELPFARVALISGSGWLERSGWRARLCKGPRWVAHLRVEANPHVNQLPAWLAELRAARVDAVVAVGGGSAIDVAKVLALGAQLGWEGTVPLPEGARRCALFAVPTTAGTGSEVTPYASFESHEGRKFSFSDPRLVPDGVVLDPALLGGQPPELAADAAADAISQATESLWSRKATDESRALAELALTALVRSGPQAVREGGVEARAQLQMAALLAGAAIAVSQTTAVHAVSYPLTARHRVPHGRALAVLLPRFVAFNAGHLSTEIAAALGRATGAADLAGVEACLRRTLAAMGLPSRLSEVGVGAADLARVVTEGYRPDRMGNNPAIPTAEQLSELLASLL